MISSGYVRPTPRVIRAAADFSGNGRVTTSKSPNVRIPAAAKRKDEPSDRMEGHPSLGTYLWRAVYWFHEGLNQNLRTLNATPVTRTQAQVLGNLALGERRPTRLARYVGISPQAMSQVLAELVSLGLIRLEADREDARARVVQLTKAGLDHQTMVRKILHDMEALLEDRYGRPVVDVVRMVVESDWPPVIPKVKRLGDTAHTRSAK